MTAFLLASAALTLVTLAILSWPLWRRRSRPSSPQPMERGAPVAPMPKPMTNPMPDPLDPLRQQLQQIDALLASGVLDAQAHADAKARIERQILDAVMTGPTASPATSQATAAATPAALPAASAVSPAAAAAADPLDPDRPRRRLIASPWVPAGLLALLVVVGGGYAWLGDPGALGTTASSATEEGSTQAPHALGKEQMEGMVDALAERLKSNPEDVDGWAMLGRSHAVLGEYEMAVDAYRKAVALRADDPVLLADFADSLAMSQGRRLAGEPAELVKKALTIDPDNPKALSLAGTEAFDRKDYAVAVKHWEHLKAVAPPGDSFAQQVDGAIAEARSLGGMPAAAPSPVKAAAASSDRSAAAGGAQVSGKVTLAPSLIAKASPDDTLFVFARAAQGGRMPLAILRKQVRDLPLEFVLDDSLSMSPAAKLSGTDRVVVGARISKSGTAIPQPGDLFGNSDTVPVGQRNLKIEISDVVK